VFAASHGLTHRLRSTSRGLGIEIDDVIWVGQGFVHVGRCFGDTGLLRECSQLLGIATHQNGIRHDHFIVRDSNASLFHDGAYRSEKMLIGAHASSDAIEYDADFVLFHEPVVLRLYLMKAYEWSR